MSSISEYVVEREEVLRRKSSGESSDCGFGEGVLEYRLELISTVSGRSAMLERVMFATVAARQAHACPQT